MSNKAPPDGQKKADQDNRSNQLNPNNPEYQRSRSPAPAQPPAKK